MLEEAGFPEVCPFPAGLNGEPTLPCAPAPAGSPASTDGAALAEEDGAAEPAASAEAVVSGAAEPAADAGSAVPAALDAELACPAP
ncbi:MAG: hypothetical protein R3F14_37680, partial [Polyangiaceae bacterium]